MIGRLVYKSIYAASLVAITSLSTTASFAALLDQTKVDNSSAIYAPGGTISKSLIEQIGMGQGDEFTGASSIYLINRDPFRSIRRGRQLFQRKFSEDEGLGPRVNFDSTGDVTQSRGLGAGLTDSCSTCHGSPKGSAGFGGNVASFPDGRDAPHLFGLGLVEQLADEITMELRATRQQAIDRAAQRNQRVTLRLRAKGVDYGRITAEPDGTVDTSKVDGINSDLRVRPFFAEGRTASMREFVIGAFKDEMGMEAWDPILCEVTDPDNPRAMTSPSGFHYDPARDSFERPPVCADWEDGDNDAVTAEIDPALVDYMEFYLLNYFKPATGPGNPFAREGSRLMRSIGCTDCHTQQMRVSRDRRVADVETKHDAEQGIFNALFAEANALFSTIEDGDTYPKLVPNGDEFIVNNFFSDLKRHDLGPAFHERDYDGTIRTEFMTEPLWGVGSTAPYGHDGRSINLDQVIRRHGGEAEDSKRRYVRLRFEDQLKIREFLNTLVLFPPDDTASNLNPGNPGSNDPQDPANHGNIALPALYQIHEYGPE
ncbi:hypothetical protein AB833_01945 [Chromatiales bacterium (ex Bugula neritina AB1)]|nr:hypothetical protein AB833_01945 [Chromatiales bacterium (ex Bugula neritina AB1)]